MINKVNDNSGASVHQHVPETAPKTHGYTFINCSAKTRRKKTPNGKETFVTAEEKRKSRRHAAKVAKERNKIVHDSKVKTGMVPTENG